jgi:hypothetical protein
MTLFATKTDRPWSTVVDVDHDTGACSHVCGQHPPARHTGPKLTLGELDERARALPYSPGAGSMYDRGGALAWILGQSAELPSAYQGGAVERRQAVEVFDPSPLAIATRARRGWLDLAGPAPPGVGPAGLLGRNREVDQLAGLIASLDVLAPEDVEEMMGR